MSDANISEAVSGFSDKMDGAMVEIAKALKDVVTQYGPDAVNLTLAAFRFDAMQQIIYGSALAAITVAIAICYKKTWAYTAPLIAAAGPYDRDGYYAVRIIGGIFGGISAVILAVGAADKLLDLSAWMAAFGYPEIRIAIKALSAAGLM